MENTQSMQEISNFSTLFDFFVQDQNGNITPETLKETGDLFDLELQIEDCQKMFMFPWEVKNKLMTKHQLSRIISLTIAYF